MVIVELVSYKVEGLIDLVGSLLLGDEDLSKQARSAIKREYEACDAPG